MAIKRTDTRLYSFNDIQSYNDMDLDINEDDLTLIRKKTSMVIKKRAIFITITIAIIAMVNILCFIDLSSAAPVFLLYIQSVLILLSRPLTIIAIVSYIIFNYKVIRPLNRDIDDFYKMNVINPLLRKNLDLLDYDKDAFISYDKIEQSDIMSIGNTFHGSDYYRAKYKNVLVESSDIKNSEVTTDSDGHSSETVIFRGRWFIFDFQKTNFANVKVLDDKFNTKIIKNTFGKNGFGTIIRNGNYNKEKNAIQMESDDFNDIYNVFTESENEAFYVLTPQFMEKLVELKKVLNCPIVCSFKNNELQLGVYSNIDSMEIPKTKKLSINYVANDVKREIWLVKTIIDTLDIPEE